MRFRAIRQIEISFRPPVTYHLTRTQLHDLGWTGPMRAVAARFGISDVALTKLCTKASIPVPPRGYWATLQAGKKVSKVALPAREPGMEDEMSVSRSQGYWNSRQTDEELLARIPDPPPFTEPIDAVRARVRKRIWRVSGETYRRRTRPSPPCSRRMSVGGRRPRSRHGGASPTSRSSMMRSAVGGSES